MTANIGQNILQQDVKCDEINIVLLEKTIILYF